MDDASDAKWLTFAELALARGINEPSARKLVRRHKWRRQTGNQGIVRTLVPAEALDRPRDDPGTDLAHDPRSDPSDEPRAIIALEAAITALREQLEQANSRADRAEQGRDGERQRADALRAQIDAADRAVAEEQARADRAEAAIVDAESDVRELRSHAAALQGELAERQAALDRTQAEAVAARERADDLQAGQVLMMDMHARAQAALQRDLDMAHAQATTSHDALKAVRQAQAERKARGLLARLRAAVSGT